MQAAGTWAASAGIGQAGASDALLSGWNPVAVVRPGTAHYGA
jgi:hypothetical protein